MLNAVDAAERGARILTRTKVVAGDQAYIFQGDDSRVIFAIPYEQDFTLIGTTEAPHESMQDPATMSGAERAYLIDFVNRYLRQPVGTDDVLSTYSGVRLLLDEAGKAASAVSREYVLDIDAGPSRPPYWQFTAAS